jgi:iron-sulfur cluster assembly protein
MIQLTQLASKKIKTHLDRRGSGSGIRVGVRTTGCSGMAYVLEFVDSPTPDDTIITTDDILVVADKKSLVYLQGMTIDYVRSGLNEGFEFVNPNERDRCGCGESFRV